MSASILGGFDFGRVAFTVALAAPVTPAAAYERLAGAPRGAAAHRRVETVVVFATNMLGGATRRSSERCGDLQHLLEKRVPDDQYALDDQRG